ERLDVTADGGRVELQRRREVRQPDRRKMRELRQHPVAAAVEPLRCLTAGFREPAGGREQGDLEAQLFIHLISIGQVACCLQLCWEWFSSLLRSRHVADAVL